MSVDFNAIHVGEKYSRKILAEIWGHKSFHAIARGVFTPSGQDTIVLFITKFKQESTTQYKDDFDGQQLSMDGEENHKNDERLANSLNNDQVHLFYRERHHSDFEYCGEVFLKEAIIKTGELPSRFVFVTGV